MRFLQAVKPRRRGKKTVWTAFSYFRGGCHGLMVRRGGIATLQTLQNHFFDPTKNTYEILTGCKTALTGQEDRLDRVLVLSGRVSRLDGEEGRDRNPSNTPKPLFLTPPKTPMRFLQAVKPRRRGKKTVWTAFPYFRGGCHGLMVRRGGIATLQTLLIHLFLTPPKTPMRFLQAVKPR